ncbi:hypothetical protein Pmani_009463 [Petrolisthes manimaculis]|uniref:Putative nuclease HARBI1 n=1 Tax=Petrolisthes manimaculis TaxID=1843537 RepID=A0AAE1UDL5_9EUCA|nr:hypothetical protein Pmani_009463 [Petrolisthes manimaculis]
MEGEASGKQYFSLMMSEVLENDDAAEALLDVRSLHNRSVSQTVEHDENVGSMLLSDLVQLSGDRQEHVRHQGYMAHLLGKEEYDFFKNLRVTKKTFEFLLDIFMHHYNPIHQGGHKPLSADTLLALTLWYLGNQTTFREISELFGLAESCVHGCIQYGIKILCTVAPTFIKWPTLEQVPEHENKFKEMAGFPGVIGALDGCHIAIKAPEETQADYIDRTSTHSVNLMAVCDSEKKFTFINAGFAGSAHDSRVFKMSPLFRRIETTPDSIFPSNNYHIIGQANEEAMLVQDGYVFPTVDEARFDEAIHLPAAIGGSEKREFVASLL